MIRLLPLSLLLLILTACGSKINKEARKDGEEAARTLVNEAAHMSNMELESFLLNVRVNENIYRENGHKRAAELYIESFEEYIKENSDSLTKLIF